MSPVVLVVEADPVAAPVLRALQGSADAHFTFESAGRCSEGLGRLIRAGRDRRQAVDAVVLELDLPDSKGIATLECLCHAAPRVPILVVGASENEAVLRLAIRHGAQDYLLKNRLDSYQLTKAVVTMMDRTKACEVLHLQRGLAQLTLDSIGDAVITVDKSCNVTYLNPVGERLTGWVSSEAFGQSLGDVFNIVDAVTRSVALNPMAQAMRESRIVALAPNCVLIRRDGVESAIEDSAAPIFGHRGEVIGAVMVFHDVSMARELSARMAHLAHHDSLTNLPNRLVLADRLNVAIAAADRQQGRLAVLYVDLDRFKRTNDTLGHGVGDGVLKVVADRLRASVRMSDTVSRHGGDEFVVMLPQIRDVQHAEMIAGKILTSVRSPCLIERSNLCLSASIGIAIYPEDGLDVDTLLKSADSAMYRAKGSGRDTYQLSEVLPPFPCRSSG